MPTFERSIFTRYITEYNKKAGKKIDFKDNEILKLNMSLCFRLACKAGNIVDIKNIVAKYPHVINSYGETHKNTAMHIIYAHFYKKGKAKLAIPLFKFLLGKGANILIENSKNKSVYSCLDDDSAIETVFDYFSYLTDDKTLPSERRRLLQKNLGNPRSAIKSTHNLSTTNIKFDFAQACQGDSEYAIFKTLADTNIPINSPLNDSGDICLHLIFNNKKLKSSTKFRLLGILISLGADLTSTNKQGDSLYSLIKNCRQPLQDADFNFIFRCYIINICNQYPIVLQKLSATRTQWINLIEMPGPANTKFPLIDIIISATKLASKNSSDTTDYRQTAAPIFRYPQIYSDMLKRNQTKKIKTILIIGPGLLSFDSEKLSSQLTLLKNLFIDARFVVIDPSSDVLQAIKANNYCFRKANDFLDCLRFIVDASQYTDKFIANDFKAILTLLSANYAKKVQIECFHGDLPGFVKVRGNEKFDAIVATSSIMYSPDLHQDGKAKTYNNWLANLLTDTGTLYTDSVTHGLLSRNRESKIDGFFHNTLLKQPLKTPLSKEEVNNLAAQTSYLRNFNSESKSKVQRTLLAQSHSIYHALRPTRGSFCNFLFKTKQGDMRQRKATLLQEQENLSLNFVDVIRSRKANTKPS